MKAISEGHLKRVNVEDDSESDSDNLDLNDLSEADLSDSEIDESQASDDGDEAATKEGLSTYS